MQDASQHPSASQASTTTGNIPEAEKAPGRSMRSHGPIFLVALGHGATHWLFGTFFILLPFITRDFGLTYTQAGVLVFTLQVTSFFCNLAGGVAVDLSGRRVIFLVACLLVGGGAMLGFGASSSYLTMIPLVSLIALSASLWHSPAIAYISQRFPAQRGYALSIHSTGASLGDMIAPGMAGLLLTWFTWHQAAMASALPAFVFAVVVGLLLLPRDTAATPGSTRGMSKKDYTRGIKAMAGRLGLVGMCLMVALRGMAQSGLTMFLPLYLADVLEVGPGMVGGTVLMMHLGAVVVSPFAGILSDRIGRRPVVMAGLLATTVIIVALTFTSNTALFVGGVSLLGFSLYSIRAVMQSWMIDVFPPELSGTATSIFFAVQAAFSTLMPLVGGRIADSYGLFEVFYLIAGVMFASNVMIFLIPKTMR